MSGVDSIATIAESPFTLTFFVPGLYNAIVHMFFGQMLAAHQFEERTASYPKWPIAVRGVCHLNPNGSSPGSAGEAAKV
jgi:hypothetical protein